MKWPGPQRQRQVPSQGHLASQSQVCPPKSCCLCDAVLGPQYLSSSKTKWHRLERTSWLGVWHREWFALKTAPDICLHSAWCFAKCYFHLHFTVGSSQINKVFGEINKASLSEWMVGWRDHNLLKWPGALEARTLRMQNLWSCDPSCTWGTKICEWRRDGSDGKGIKPRRAQGWGRGSALTVRSSLAGLFSLQFLNEGVEPADLPSDQDIKFIPMLRDVLIPASQLG